MVKPLFPTGDRTVIYGEPGSYKSWILLHLAIHLAHGKPWLGFPVPKARAGVYVDEEMSRHTLARRLERLLAGAGLEPPPNLYVLSGEDFRLDPPKFNETGSAKRLLATCAAKGFQPEFFILETLRRIMTGDENEAKDIREFWRQLEPLHNHGQRAVFVSHHMTKPREGQDSRTRAAGSSDIIGGADAAMSIVRAENLKTKELRIVIKSEKLREAEEWSAKSLKIVGTGETEPVQIELA